MKKSTSRIRLAIAVALLAIILGISPLSALAQVATTPPSHGDATRPQDLSDDVRERRQVYLWVLVKGTVGDAQGQPIPDAEVTLLRPTDGDMERHRTHRTNRKGKFAFRTCSRAGYYLVTTTDGNEKSSNSDAWIRHGRRFPGLVLTRHFQL